MRSRRSGATTRRRRSSERSRGRSRCRAIAATTFLLLAFGALAPPISLALPAESGDAFGASARRGVEQARAAAGLRTVKLRDSYFSPSLITAKGTTTLRFVWAGELTHNLDGRGIPDRYLKARRRYKPLERTYGRGVYRFLCTIHPGMEMKLRVR